MKLGQRVRTQDHGDGLPVRHGTVQALTFDGEWALVNMDHDRLPPWLWHTGTIEVAL